MIILPRKNQLGATTLVIATMLLVTATLIVLFAGSYSLMQQKITANQYRNQQAYAAAEAGLEFGINYLQANTSAITGSPSGGHIPNYTSASTTNVTLANNAKFSIVYTNPVASNYNLIQITSTGISDDGTATRVVQQQVQYGSVLFTPSQNSLTTKGSVVLSGNATLKNTQYNTNMVLANGVTMSGNVSTVTSTGTSSTPGHIGSDIQQNNATLAAMSVATLFSDYFGAPYATIQSQMAHVYTSSGASNYSSILNGITGTTVWINQTSGVATISGNTTIGSPTKPVLLIVNGPINISGNTNLYGFLFVVGTTAATTDISGNLNINGGMATGDNLNISGNTNITYNSSLLVGVQTSASTTYFAKVPGSWKDF
ncbi:MAG: PilX N-terminal domain-containing pilus assembly protein [Pseudomonadota bacterium]